MKYEQLNEVSGISLLFAAPEDQSYFFGYYDQSPLSRDGKMLLAHRVAFDGRDLREGDRCQIGYFTLADGVYHIIDEVNTFNWQQGARLQWLPPYEYEVIYNTSRDGKFISCRYDVDTGGKRYYELPIYSVHPSGKFALTIDFAHLRYCRYGYGYCGGDYPHAAEPVPDGDGVFRLDLVSGEASTFVATKDLLPYRNHIMPDNCRHWIEHMTWNRSGSRTALYFRYGDANSIGMYTQLFTCDDHGKALYEFTANADYSHLGWNDDQEFIVFSRPYSRIRDAYSQASKNKQKSLVQYIMFASRPIYRFWKNHLSSAAQRQKISNGNMGYYVFKDGEMMAKAVLCGVLTTDGHPSYHPQYSDIILTDTYADEDGYRHLLLVNIASQRCLELGKFYSNHYINDHRCDLHPRWDFSGTKIIIDTPHDFGGRHTIIYDAETAIRMVLSLR